MDTISKGGIMKSSVKGFPWFGIKPKIMIAHWQKMEEASARLDAIERIAERRYGLTLHEFMLRQRIKERIAFQRRNYL